MWKMIKDFIAGYFTKATPVQVVDRTTGPAAVDLLPGSSYAAAIGEVAQTVGTVVTVENTPQMIQGRLNQREQAERDRIAKDAYEALKSGKLGNVEKDLS